MKIDLTLDDFNFLWSTACSACYWDDEQEERFEIVKPKELGYDAEIPEQSGWMMYWLGDMTSKSDALLAWKIIKAAGHDAYLLWDCSDPAPTLIDPLYDHRKSKSSRVKSMFILTDYRGSYA